MDRFGYHTTWGTQRLDDRNTRFSLWAPRHDALVLVHPGGAIEMERAEDGWFEIVTDRVPEGGAYAFRLPDGQVVPDPAARAQMADVHGPSRLVDPHAYQWRTHSWQGRPWEEAVIYELHIGTFTEAGTFQGAESRLDHLLALGVTAIEIMPVAHFGGTRGWGYDGALLYAPHSVYGGPEGLKALVDAAHERGLMIVLDVVYNHFGPEGNYFHCYAPEFFHKKRTTAWGSAIAYERREVRDFFVDNALYWLEEFRFDGLRLDAVHAIFDDSDPDILEELAQTVRERCGASRHVHLILENYDNAAHYLERTEEGRPRHYTAQWNDDIHHACHVLATGERAAYYEDFADAPLAHLARCLAEGFAYQGEPSRHDGGKPRGETSAHLPPGAFIGFLQNHDQVGNRALGERLSSLASSDILIALRALVLLAPAPPALFMGEEWGALEPFLFFCDFKEELGVLVRDGRRREFEKFPEFSDPALRETIPDPNLSDTFERSRLDWSRLEEPFHAEWLTASRELLRLRQQEIVPRLAGIGGHAGTARQFGAGGLYVEWTLGDGSSLSLVANLSGERIPAPAMPPGRVLYSTDAVSPASAPSRRTMSPWSIVWTLSS